MFAEWPNTTIEVRGSTSNASVKADAFQAPAVYEGIDVFTMTPEELKYELEEDKRHYQAHIDWLELSRKKMILDGLCLEDTKVKLIDNGVLICEMAIQEIDEVLQAEELDQLAVFQLCLKHIAVINGIQDLERELDLGITYGREAAA